MKVRELIKELERFDPEDDVHIGYNYGDYWGTTVAPRALQVEEAAVVHSDYHNMPKVLPAEVYDPEEDPEAEEAVAVVISAVRL